MGTNLQKQQADELGELETDNALCVVRPLRACRHIHNLARSSITDSLCCSLKSCYLHSWLQCGSLEKLESLIAISK